MSELLCPICHQTNTCDKFLAQHCGHVFCQECTSQFGHERKCPSCRSEWGSRPPSRIYLEFPVLDKSTRIVDHLENLDMESPTIYLKKSGAILKGLADSPDATTSHDTAVLLADAARRLEQRVAPLASELEITRQENETMRQQLKHFDAQLKSKHVLVADIDELNRNLKEREVTITMIRDDLAHEKQKRQSEQDANRRFTRSLRKKQEELTIKEKEINTLRFEIQERDKELSLMKSKLRALVKSTKRSKTTVQSPADSLVVEHPLPLSEIENSGNAKRPPKSASGRSNRLSAFLSVSKGGKAGAT